MKVTSEQLLDLFGLKVGDSIEVNFLIEEFVPKLETINFKVKEDLMLEGKSKIRSYLVEKHLVVLLDKDYEIIKPKPTLTDDEKVELKLAIINGCNWVFRNKDGGVFAKYQKPVKTKLNIKYWSTFSETTTIELDCDKFQFITWEDEEPYNIEELLKGSE